jgi:hypothetical protein
MDWSRWYGNKYRCHGSNRCDGLDWLHRNYWFYWPDWLDRPRWYCYEYRCHWCNRRHWCHGSDGRNGADWFYWRYWLDRSNGRNGRIRSHR